MKPGFFASLSTLQWALLVSALLHGVLLSLRWVDGAGLQRALSAPALDVVLVNARTDAAPPQPQAIAQAHLAGGGNQAERGLIATPLPPQPLAALAGDDPVSENQRRIAAMLTQQEQLLVQVRRQLDSLPLPDAEAPADDAEAEAQRERRLQLSRLLAAIEQRVEEASAQPRKRYLSPATLGTPTRSTTTTCGARSRRAAPGTFRRPRAASCTASC